MTDIKLNWIPGIFKASLSEISRSDVYSSSGLLNLLLRWDSELLCRQQFEDNLKSGSWRFPRAIPSFLTRLGTLLGWKGNIWTAICHCIAFQDQLCQYEGEGGTAGGKERCDLRGRTWEAGQQKRLQSCLKAAFTFLRRAEGGQWKELQHNETAVSEMLNFGRWKDFCPSAVV